jgi:RNA polymerase sigma-B factor
VLGYHIDMSEPPTTEEGSPASNRARDALLISRWRCARDERARDEFVRRYMPLARNLARRYAHTSEPFDDLFQVACLGLLKALYRFDPDRGVSFTAFAVPTMLGELRRHFRDTTRSIHVPRGLQERSLAVQEATARLESDTGRSPTVHDLAQYLELDMDMVVEALEVATTHRPSSLDARVDTGQGDEASTRYDVIGQVDPGYGLFETSASLTSAIRDLPVADRKVFALRYAQGLTQREIAGIVGVSQMQVSRILRRMTNELRRTRSLGEPPQPKTRSRSERV